MSNKYGAWCGLDDKAGDGNLKYEEVDAKAADEDDIDVKVLYCGLCGSDAGALHGHFGPVNPPRVCGHEIVGEVVKAGPKVTNVKVGDMVGIGAQCDSCRECEWCKSHKEQFCPKMAWTFGGQWAVGKAKGQPVKGGFAKSYRGPSRFAVKLPAGLDPSTAGPLMCGGVTVFSPMKVHGVGKGSKVGIIGIGGLGHMGVIIAKALGADVTAISRGESKKDDALKLGADRYIPTGKNLADDFKGHEGSLDLIVCTINPSHLPINDYVSLLRPLGKFVMVGIVPNPLEVATFPLISGGKSVGGSPIGSPSDIADLLELMAAKKLSPWVEKYDMDDINTALKDFNEGKPKYRYVLVNKDNGGKM